MSIRLKLLLIGSLSIAAVTLLSTLLYFSVQSFNHALEKNKISYQIAHAAFERRLVLDEYLLHGLERSKQQWSTVSKSLAAYIQEKTQHFSGYEEKKMIENIIQRIEENGNVFFQLISLNEKDGNQWTEKVKNDQKSRLVGQLLVQAQDLILQTGQLTALSHEEATKAQKDIITVLSAFIAGFLVILSSFIFFLWKSIVKPIAQLQKGTENIAKGNLKYRVKVLNDNEVGRLAFSFNQMTDKLHLSMEKIEEELQKFKLAFDNVSDHIIITNPEGVILYANKGAENLTGYTQNEIIGKRPSSWGNLMPKVFYKNMWKTIKQKKKEFTGIIVNKKKNGKVYHAQLKIAPIFDTSGKIKLFVGIERDITKEKEIDQAKTEFVLLASHQLRTPLSSINWYTEMLLAGDVGNLRQKQRHYLDKVLASSRHMVKLVNTLLDISHLELGTFVVNPQAIDVIKLAKNVIEELKLEIQIKKITFSPEFAEKTLIIFADPKLLQMVFYNLLSNAIKYCPEEQGKIELKIITEKTRHILIQISDNGLGIPKNQQEKVFTKLFRADNARDKDTKGAGLGLYIVKSIVVRLGGKIWFESEENSGTTFYIKLPLKTKKISAATKKEVSAP